MPVNSNTIDWIFGRMCVRYGAAWAAKWGGADLDAVRDDWREELARCSRESILYAMGYLPLDFPPTVAQFHAICLRAPSPEPALQLPAPPADPVRVEREIAKMRARQAASPKAWAYRLRDREAEQRKGEGANWHNGILTKA